MVTWAPLLQSPTIQFNAPLMTLVPVSVAPASCTFVDVTVPLIFTVPLEKTVSPVRLVVTYPPVKLPVPESTMEFVRESSMPALLKTTPVSMVELPPVLPDLIKVPWLLKVVPACP